MNYYHICAFFRRGTPLPLKKRAKRLRFEHTTADSTEKTHAPGTPVATNLSERGLYYSKAAHTEFDGYELWLLWREFGGGLG